MRMENDLSVLQPSFRQVPFDLVVERADNGNAVLSELSKIFMGCSEIEEKHISISSKISKTTLYENEIPQSSAEFSLGHLKNYFYYLTKQQTFYRKSLESEVLVELESFRAQRALLDAPYKVSAQNAIKEVQMAADVLSRSKRHYIKTIREIQLLREKVRSIENNIDQQSEGKTDEKSRKEKENNYLMGRVLSAFEMTPEQERERLLRKIQKLEYELLQHGDDITIKKQTLASKISVRDMAIEQACAALQESEKLRLEKMAGLLRRYCALERQALVERTDGLAKLANAVDAMDPNWDLQLFIHKEKKPDSVHQYGMALQILDTEHRRRMIARNRKAEDDRTLAIRNMLKNQFGANHEQNSQVPQTDDTSDEGSRGEKESGGDVGDWSDRDSVETPVDHEIAGLLGTGTGTSVTDGESFSLSQQSSKSKGLTSSLNYGEFTTNSSTLISANNSLKQPSSSSRSKTVNSSAGKVHSNSNDKGDGLLTTVGATSDMSSVQPIPSTQQLTSGNNEKGKVQALSQIEPTPPPTPTSSPFWSPLDLMHRLLNTSEGVSMSSGSTTATQMTTQTPPVSSNNNNNVSDSNSSDVVMLNPSNPSIKPEEEYAYTTNEVNPIPPPPPLLSSSATATPRPTPPTSTQTLTMQDLLQLAVHLIFSDQEKSSDTNREYYRDADSETTSPIRKSQQLRESSLSAPSTPPHLPCLAPVYMSPSPDTGVSPHRPSCVRDIAGHEDGTRSSPASLKLQSSTRVSESQTPQHLLSSVDNEDDIWRSLFKSEQGRHMFLQQLDIRRGVKGGLLGERGFETMTRALQVFLDYCQQEKDITSALRTANMANTFHRCLNEQEYRIRGIPIVAASSSPDHRLRVYLQGEVVVRCHEIWRSPGFWPEALLQAISRQLEKEIASDLVVLPWDDMSGDNLRETVIGLHNIVFGQLGTMAFTMHEIGMTREEVEESILKMSGSDLMQLGEEQRIELLKSIRKTFGFETPLPTREQQKSMQRGSLRFSQPTVSRQNSLNSDNEDHQGASVTINNPYEGYNRNGRDGSSEVDHGSNATSVEEKGGSGVVVGPENKSSYSSLSDSNLYSTTTSSYCGDVQPISSPIEYPLQSPMTATSQGKGVDDGDNNSTLLSQSQTGSGVVDDQNSNSNMSSNTTVTTNVAISRADDGVIEGVETREEKILRLRHSLGLDPKKSPPRSHSNNNSSDITTTISNLLLRMNSNEESQHSEDSGKHRSINTTETTSSNSSSMSGNVQLEEIPLDIAQDGEPLEDIGLGVTGHLTSGSSSHSKTLSSSPHTSSPPIPDSDYDIL